MPPRGKRGGKRDGEAQGHSVQRDHDTHLVRRLLQARTICGRISDQVAAWPVRSQAVCIACVVFIAVLPILIGLGRLICILLSVCPNLMHLKEFRAET